MKFGPADVKAYVVGNEGNRIWVLLESTEQLAAFIASAVLTLSQTDLLERLAERISEVPTTNPPGMLTRAFGHQPAKTGFGVVPPRVAERVGSGASSMAIAHAMGSEVTFLWGPPGTGKTFTIAGLVTALVESGETVLVTSHTHAAVEQALWAAVEPPSEGRDAGLLHGSQWVADGQILKIGPLRDPKIPADCHLDSRLEEDAARRYIRAQRHLATRSARRPNPAFLSRRGIFHPHVIVHAIRDAARQVVALSAPTTAVTAAGRS